MNLCTEDSEYSEGVRRSMSEPFRPLNHRTDCRCDTCRHVPDAYDRWSNVLQGALLCLAIGLGVVAVIAQLYMRFF